MDGNLLSLTDFILEHHFRFPCEGGASEIREGTLHRQEQCAWGKHERVTRQWSILVNTHVQSHALLRRGLGTSCSSSPVSVSESSDSEQLKSAKCRLSTFSSIIWQFHVHISWAVQHSIITKTLSTIGSTLPGIQQKNSDSGQVW